MTNAYGNVNVPPSFEDTGSFAPGPELLYSYHRFTQKGGTLKASATTEASDGVLLTGTPLAKESASGKYIPVNSTNTTDKIVGFLRDSADTSGGDLLCNIVRSGLLRNDVITAAVKALDATTGGLASAQVTQINARIDADINVLIF